MMKIQLISAIILILALYSCSSEGSNSKEQIDAQSQQEWSEIVSDFVDTTSLDLDLSIEYEDIEYRNKIFFQEEVKGNPKDVDMVFYRVDEVNGLDELTEVFGNSRSFRYDENQNLLAEHNTYEGDSIATTVFSYSEKGQLTNWVTTDTRDGAVTTQNYAYHEGCNLLKWMESEDKQRISTYNYDSIGRLIEEKTLNTEQNTMSRTEFFYHGQTTRLEKFSNYYLTVEFHKEFFYDEEGRIIQETINKNSGYSNTTSYVYDEKDNIIGEITSGLTEDFEYEYDENSNWISKTTYLNGSKSRVQKRVISYY